METKNKITDYMPIEEQELVLIQGKASKDLVRKVRYLLTCKGWSWNDLISASLEKFLKEHQAKE